MLPRSGPSQVGGKRRKEQDLPRWCRKPPFKVHRISPPATSWDAGGRNHSSHRQGDFQAGAGTSIDCFRGTGKEERIPFLLGLVEAQPTGRYVQIAVGVRKLPGSPAPPRGTALSRSQCDTGGGKATAELRPCCHQQWPGTAEISSRQQSQLPQCWHKRGNAVGKETEA